MFKIFTIINLTVSFIKFLNRIVMSSILHQTLVQTGIDSILFHQKPL